VSDVFGRFDDANAFMAQVEKSRFDANDADGVEDVVKARMMEMREAGEELRAVEEGASYLQRAAALPESSGRDSLWILSVERRGGRITSDEYAARRAQWLERKGPVARGDAQGRSGLWALAYALQAETEDEAREAMAALPDSGLRIALSDEYMSEATGRVLVLTGKPREAIPYLEAEATCTIDFFGVRANYWLGRAREALGEKERACAAYGAVLAYWGDAKPRSVTADAARGRAKGLGCP
jgi:serine/threonine-protein kinase